MAKVSQGKKLRSVNDRRVQVDSRLGVGLYSVADTARVLSFALKHRITRTSLSRWAHGRQVFSDEAVREYAPIVNAQLKVADSYLFTFADLIELMTVAALRNKGLSIKTIRHAYERASELFGEHPFAKREYSVYGKGIFEKLKSYDGTMEELSTGRLAFEQVVKPLLENVSYAADMATMFSPLGSDRTVVLDPSRGFGAPINKETGVPTYVLYGMVEEGESEESVADWYGVSIQGVRDAVEYESALRTAA